MCVNVSENRKHVALISKCRGTGMLLGIDNAVDHLNVGQEQNQFIGTIMDCLNVCQWLTKSIHCNAGHIDQRICVKGLGKLPQTDIVTSLRTKKL